MSANDDIAALADEDPEKAQGGETAKQQEEEFQNKKIEPIVRVCQLRMIA